MGALSPLESFLVGVAVAGLGLGLALFFLKRAVARHREQYPDGFPHLQANTRPEESDVAALQQRLQAIEQRLSDIEKLLRKQVLT